MGEQWLRLNYNAIILVDRIILTDKFVLYLALSHSTITHVSFLNM